MTVYMVKKLILTNNFKRSIFKSKLRKMSKKAQKQLNLNVMRILKDNGIIHNLHAKLMADTAEAIQKSDINSMKCFKDPKTDIDSQIAANLVFSYLKKYNMTETIRCIQSEMQNLKETKINIPKELHLDENDLQKSGNGDFLSSIISKYISSTDEITQSNHDNLLQAITERLNSLQDGQEYSNPDFDDIQNHPIKGAAPYKTQYTISNKMGPENGVPMEENPLSSSLAGVRSDKKIIRNSAEKQGFLEELEPLPELKEPPTYIPSPHTQQILENDDFDDFDDI
ncbi:hypothetical protein TRFO_03740 [Tritrichomonas foetus]|uniref:LisH domain-containing protein n=1 Tax=Tritrichomonas foetus TaxID=1144522 RepID=A0A1J4KLD3_9EUKA|nr:hypothetical protein TRFO_03740 [Tritrichomonas foetus]|eukprot:OHT12111.1 hypothetical protein TRFO_03740 [Tritrichomonas foetus]